MTPPSLLVGSLHDRRVRFLESLAGLLGCTGQVPYLPDGRRPDVLAIDARRRLLFVGEGKDSETPNCRATQARLQRYLQWVAAHLRHGAAAVVCAVCFGRESDARAWLDVLAMLAAEEQVTFVREGFVRFEPGLLMVYAVACEPPLPRLDAPACAVQAGTLLARSSLRVAGPLAVPSPDPAVVVAPGEGRRHSARSVATLAGELAPPPAAPHRERSTSSLVACSSAATRGRRPESQAVSCSMPVPHEEAATNGLPHRVRA